MNAPKEGGIWQYVSAGFSLGDDAQVSLDGMQKCLDEFCNANGIEPGKSKFIINTGNDRMYAPSFGIVSE